MKYYLLEIVTVSGLAFIYGENGPFIYNDPIEAQQDAHDNGEEGIVEVFLQPNGEIKTDFYDWKFIQKILALNGFCEEKYKEYVKSFLRSAHSSNT